MEVTNSPGPCCFHLREGAGRKKKICWKNREHEIRLITHIPLCCKLFIWRERGGAHRYTFTCLSQCTRVTGSATESLFYQQATLNSLNHDGCKVAAEIALAL